MLLVSLPYLLSVVRPCLSVVTVCVILIEEQQLNWFEELTERVPIPLQPGTTLGLYSWHQALVLELVEGQPWPTPTARPYGSRNVRPARAAISPIRAEWPGFAPMISRSLRPICACSAADIELAEVAALSTAV